MKVARRKRRLANRIKQLPGFARRRVGTLGQLMINDAERRHIEKGGKPLTSASEIMEALEAAGHVGDGALPTTPGLPAGGAVALAEEAQEEPNRELFKRQVVERKEMKAQVAQLKRERKKLRPKVVAERQRKKEISHAIKDLQRGMERRHDAEARAELPQEMDTT